MRYQNWDVLLFPGDSKTPVQEFDTKCFVLDQNLGGAGDAASNKARNSFESMTLVPILTTFVATLEGGETFRISIHSWEKPKPSQLLLSYKAPDELALFEARVYLDGILVAQRTFDENIWPEVIGDPGYSYSSQLGFRVADGLEERNGRHLHFPKFHREILQQPDWEPGEVVGRVKIVLAEGVLRENTPPASSAVRFDRLRDVVAFSFQHAPQDILEFSNIAWPNQKMFTDMQNKASRLGPIGSRVSGLPGHEAHSHSPRRRPTIASPVKTLSAGDAYQTLLHSRNPSVLEVAHIGKGSSLGKLKNVSPEHRIIGKSMAQEDDPFVSTHQSPAAIQKWRSMLRSSSHDISMTDFNSNKSLVNTEMSGVSATRGNFATQVNDANPEEIADALSPAGREQLLKVLSASNSPASGMGTRPPTNTPQLSADFKDITSVNQAVNKDSALGGVHTKLWRGTRPRLRTWSESTSNRSTSASKKGNSKESNSPAVREMSLPLGGNQSVAVAPRRQSLKVNRQRSSSWKRKRRSTSPADGLGSTVRVPVAPLPSCSGSDE